MVEGSSAHDDFIEIATKRLLHLFADFLFHLLADDRHVEQQFHLVVLYLGEHALTDDFLDNQWHGNDDGRLDFLESLCNDCRTWHTGEEEDVTAVGELENKFKGHAIHVCHGQNAHRVGAVRDMDAYHLIGKVEIAPQGTVGQHHSL